VSGLTEKFEVLQRVLFRGHDGDAIEKKAVEIFIDACSSTNARLFKSAFRNADQLGTALAQLRDSRRYHGLVKSRILHGSTHWKIMRDGIDEGSGVRGNVNQKHGLGSERSDVVDR
jgi:hypothetical protein